MTCWLPLIVLFGAGALLSRVSPSDRTARSILPTVVADWSWLKADLAWEAQDEASARAWSGAAIAAAPLVDYFRVNAARMRAFDFPVWRGTREPAAPESVRARWREEFADEAIELLLSGEEPTAECLIEAGNIALYAKRDAALAAGFYRRAAELPGAPWHAGRLYAELLRGMGRAEEALTWLRAWWPRLPADDPAAQRELVAARIVELERELARRRDAL
jgi:hypothetical protein